MQETKRDLTSNAASTQGTSTWKSNLCSLTEFRSLEKRPIKMQGAVATCVKRQKDFPNLPFFTHIGLLLETVIRSTELVHSDIS